MKEKDPQATLSSTVEWLDGVHFGCSQVSIPPRLLVAGKRFEFHRGVTRFLELTLRNIFYTLNIHPQDGNSATRTNSEVVCTEKTHNG